MHQPNQLLGPIVCLCILYYYNSTYEIITSFYS